MDEVLELCRRVLGASPLADQAVAQAQSEPHRARVPKLAAAIKACRSLAGDESGPAPDVAADATSDAPGDATGLAGAVARELSAANARLPERGREVLALRELLHLSHKEIARAMHTSQSGIPLQLAQARLALQAQRRGIEPDAACEERERTLGLLACRQDGEPLGVSDEEWLFAHLAQCEGCGTAHAAMLEASVCYRAWQPAPAPPTEPVVTDELPLEPPPEA
jgi:hypothetical protein